MTTGLGEVPDLGAARNSLAGQDIAALLNRYLLLNHVLFLESEL